MTNRLTRRRMTPRPHRKRLAFAGLAAGVLMTPMILLMPAVAHAQSGVRLYGRIDLGLAYQRINVPDTPIPDDQLDGLNKSQFGMRSGQQTGSRWGIKGHEDLGGGQSINFVYEVGVTASTGVASSRARVSTMGVEGRTWGVLDLGRRPSAGSYAVSDVDPINGSYDTASLVSSMGTYAIRYSNQIWYRTPEFSGFTAAVSYSFDIGTDTFYLVGNRPQEVEIPADLAPGQREFSTHNKNRALSLGLRYQRGPLVLGASYDQIYPIQGTIAAIPKQSPKAWIVGGTYDLKVVKLAAAIGQQVDGLIQGGQALSRAGITGGITNTQGDILLFPGAKVNAWMVGATLPLASGQLFGSLQQARPGGTIVTTGADRPQTVGSVGYSYSMSKRTSAYAYFSYAKNYLFVEGSVRTLGVGVVHRF